MGYRIYLSDPILPEGMGYNLYANSRLSLELCPGVLPKSEVLGNRGSVGRFLTYMFWATVLRNLKMTFRELGVMGRSFSFSIFKCAHVCLFVDVWTRVSLHVEVRNYIVNHLQYPSPLFV